MSLRTPSHQAPAFRTRNRLGLTIIELVVFLLILSVVALIAVPSVDRTSADRLRGAIDMLVSDLEYARVASMSNTSDPCVVVFDTTDHEYHLALESDPLTPITNPIGNLPYLTSYGNGRASHLTEVRISEVSMGGDSRIGFGRFGELDQATAATITLASGSRSVVITLDPTTGEPSIGTMN